MVVTLFPCKKAKEHFTRLQINNLLNTVPLDEALLHKHLA